MKLRYAADVRTLVWALFLFPGVVIAAYARPDHALAVLPFALYAGFCAGVFTHYHNHCPVFVGRKANALYACWLSFFYGYPAFAWIPTHNANHHKFVNAQGDATITWRYSRRDTLFTAVTFFFVSSYWQAGLIRDFIRKARRSNPRQYRQILLQYATVILGHVSMLALAIGLHGLRRGALVYGCSLGASAAMGLWGMMAINYIQHVHCDPSSEYDHSRNFVGGFANWLVFNSGYHTAHHERAGAHWSTLPALHATIASKIHPDLNQPSIVGYVVKSYLLGPILPSFRPRQVGRAAWDAPPVARAGRAEELPAAAAQVAA